MRLVKVVKDTNTPIHSFNQILEASNKVSGIVLPKSIVFEKGNLVINSNLMSFFKQLKPSEKLVILNIQESRIVPDPSKQAKLIDLLELMGDKFGHLLLSSDSIATLTIINDLIDEHGLNCSVLPSLKSKDFNGVESHYFKADLRSRSEILQQMSNGKSAIVEYLLEKRNFSSDFNKLCTEISNAGMGRKLWLCSDKPKEVVDYVLRKRFNGIIAGSSFRNAPSVTIPLISVQDKLNLRNIRAIVGLPDTDAWKHTIVLGMNVLNHCSFRIDRTQIPGIFECYESLTSSVEGSSRSRFDHVLIDNQYLLIEDHE